jgi:histidine triad (HIT) family protein
MKDCIFCEIAKKEVNAYVVQESENFLAFLDIHPHVPGHTLVIPKDHYGRFLDLPVNLGEEFIKIVKETALLLSKTLETKDFTFGINEGSYAGQAVNHLHLHIMPRFKNDGGGSIHSVVFNQPKESVEEIYSRIRGSYGSNADTLR